MTSEAPLLEVRGVSVRFGGLQALDDVSFEVRTGEVLALIGPNGAGKSTLLNIVSGALRADAGEIRLRGDRIDGLAADRINARGLVRTFQGAEILRGMTVRENVMAAGAARSGIGVLHGLAGWGPSRRAASRLEHEALDHLEVVGLAHLADAPAGALTAGQQRLLAVARALGTGAELLILDEPGAGLSTVEKVALAEVITSLRRRGKTVVFVEHDLGFVGRLAGRMVVLDHGRLIAAGAPDAVRADPKVIEAYLGNTEIAVARGREAASAPAAAAGLLEVESAAVRYGGLIALDSVSLRIGHREIVAIVGANGAGKSTLLKAIAGVAPLASGRIRFVGEDIGRVAPEERVRLGIGLAPEGRQLFGSLSVRDNLAVGRYARVRAAGLRHLVRPSGAEGRDLEAAMAEVFGFFPRLAERAGQPAGTLSGGEGQMLAIGRALMNRPRLLMLDEPSFGLAPQIAKEILEALPRLTALGISILLVEQNARAALQIAARAYVLVTGRVAAEGPSDALLADRDIAQKYLGWDGSRDDGRERPAGAARLVAIK
jgi:branched-chain amino acid transport system ATP-binding protein